jgi:hypothetical protein
MSKKPDQNEMREAAREAHEHGESASEARATQGASKQPDHKSHHERRRETARRKDNA